MKRFITIIVTLALAATSLRAGGEILRENYGKYMDDVKYCYGVNAYLVNDYANAKSIFEDCLASGAENPWIYYYLGNIAFAEENPQKAFGYYKKAKDLEPGNFWFAEAYTNLYINTVPEEKALAALEELSQIRNDSNTQIKITAVLLRLGRAEEADNRIDEYREAGLEMNSRCYSLFAQSALASDNDSLALKYYNYAIEEDPDDMLAVYYKAEIYRAAGNFPEFLVDATDFFKSKLTPIDAKREYYKYLVQQHPTEYLLEHKECFDSVTVAFVQTHPTDTSALSTSGLYYLHTGEIEKAKTSFLVNANVNAADPKWAYYHISFLDYIHEYDELAKYAGIYYKKYKDFSFLWYQQQAYVQAEQYDQALDIINKVIAGAKTKQEKAALYGYEADVFLLKADHTSEPSMKSILTSTAYSLYEKSIKLDKTSPNSFNNYAYNLALRGERLDYALKLSRKACELEKDNATYLDTLGYICYLMGQYKLSKDIFIKALGYGGKEHSVIVAHYADVLNALGEKASAAYYYNLAKQLEQE